jgi:hypothetical protein
MGVREKLKRLIDAKQSDIVTLESDLVAARAYLQALQESFRLMPKEGENGVPITEMVPREGSSVAKARDLIASEKRPLHIVDILAKLGLENTKKNRVAVAGSLWRYVKKGEIFIKAGPNTFGLKGMENLANDPDDLEIPAAFGKQ